MKPTVFVTVILFAYSSSQESEEQEAVDDSYDDIQDLMVHLIKMYENPSITTHSLFRETGIIYFNKLVSLEKAVRAEVPEAKRLVHSLYKEGLYKQLKDAPFSMLVGHYGWNEHECVEYENLVFKANDIWRYFLKDVIQEKEPSLPMENRVFVFENPDKY